MCGLIGFFTRQSGSCARAAVLAGRDAMEHRGPDDAGYVSLEDGRVQLAHRRLSIQDLSRAGHQPMRHHTRELWTAYNGEIYNFLELSAELVAQNEAFQSKTDTEVLLALYARHGEQLFPHLRGMFAFAMWDGVEKRMLLARDRIGKKPLYYVHDERGLAFASSLRALVVSGWVDPELHEEVVPEYLALGRVGAPDTLLRGVSKLPPGCLLIADDEGRVVVRRYDTLRFHETDDAADLDERLHETLRESVALRLVSDVPVGVTLSGGVDSSLVAALIAENGSVPLRTFTVGFRDDGEGLDETTHARTVAEHIGADHHEVWIAPEDVTRTLPEFDRHVDEPHPNLIWMASWFVSRLAKENGVTVVLTGDGGDELFFGYDRWRALHSAYRRWLRPMERMPGVLRGAAWWAVRGLVRDTAARELFRRASQREAIYWGPMFHYPEAQRPLLSRRGRALLAEHSPGHRFENMIETDFVQKVRRVGIEGHLVEDFLARLDRMGMAVSVEGRAPLLDQEVVALAASYPVDRLVRDGVGKIPLRDLVGRYYPASIIERPKKGFCAPVLTWMRGPLLDTIREELAALGDEFDLFDRDALQSEFDAPETRRDANRMWGLVALSRWWRHLRSLRPTTLARP